jgi:hypothetical protein
MSGLNRMKGTGEHTVEYCILSKVSKGMRNTEIQRYKKVERNRGLYKPD